MLSGWLWQNLCLFVILLYSMETKIITIDNVKTDASAIKAAAGILDGGGLVAFPTETVYGIGCMVSSEAIERLDAVKNRPQEKRYTLHIGDESQLAEYVPVVGLRAKKLISKVWPGPLTVVFQLNGEDLKKQREKLGDDCFEILYRDGSIGVRCPDDPVAGALLSETKSAIVAPSANLAGEAPATRWSEVEAVFSGKIDAILVNNSGKKDGNFA
ncbi:MAG: threonylcarbamoyl-AMP synthase [Planctomycetes bacterium]|nr:threonylcarbamoyl-AMP synthase [Planctomycetota bacterium]